MLALGLDQFGSDATSRNEDDNFPLVDVVANRSDSLGSPEQCVRNGFPKSRSTYLTDPP
jgi:hypothetical protein